jgi:hypothetical protein
MPLIWVYHYGEVDIAYWEWVLGAVYLILLYVYFARQKNLEIKKAPEYKYFLWGLFAKVLGGIAFSMIYYYYYRGGDTIMYFYSAVSMGNLAKYDLSDFLGVLFGPNDQANLNKFNLETGYPYAYMYFDSRSFFVIRLISPIVLFTFNSYLITTLMLSSICYIGIWRCYRTFVSYYPQLAGKFAIAFLFMPSVVFWGSAIMKDTFTLSAACWWFHCADEVLFKKRKYVFNTIGLVLSATLLIVMKPYIFMSVMPVTMLWVLYFRVARLKNALFKFILLPAVLVTMLGGSFFVLNSLGDKLDKFSLEKAGATVVTIQSDMKRSDQYGSNYFDIGEVDGTLPNLLSKFPVAVNAAFYRPYLWETRSVVTALSGLENFWLLFMTLVLLWRTRFWFFFRAMYGNPLILASMLFALLLGFMIGISTPNFGALVRFKIPFVPFLVAGLYIMDHLNRKRLFSAMMNRRFSIQDYLWGDAGPTVVATPRGPVARKRSAPSVPAMWQGGKPQQ